MTSSGLEWDYLDCQFEACSRPPRVSPSGCRSTFLPLRSPTATDNGPKLWRSQILSIWSMSSRSRTGHSASSATNGGEWSQGGGGGGERERRPWRKAAGTGPGREPGRSGRVKKEVREKLFSTPLSYLAWNDQTKPHILLRSQEAALLFDFSLPPFS